MNWLPKSGEGPLSVSMKRAYPWGSCWPMLPDTSFRRVPMDGGTCLESVDLLLCFNYLE